MLEICLDLLKSHILPFLYKTINEINYLPTFLFGWTEEISSLKMHILHTIYDNFNFMVSKSYNTFVI